MINSSEIEELLSKAEQSINASELLYKDGFIDFSASRSYYTMFYTLEALLLSRNLSYSKHSAVISAFGKEYIKPGIFDKKYHQFVINAFDLRNNGDYGAMNSITKEEAYNLIEQSKELYNIIKKYLFRKT